jgi:predicted P-loop ATPase
MNKWRGGPSSDDPDDIPFGDAWEPGDDREEDQGDDEAAPFEQRPRPGPDSGASNGGNDSWRQGLILDKGRQPKPLVANVIIALREAPELAGILLFDAFHMHVIARGKLPWMAKANEAKWTDQDDVRLASWLQHQGIEATPNVVAQAVETVAQDRPTHPVLAYLERCRWDGEERLDEWAIEYLGAPDTPFVRAASARWMISGVARVHQPGCKVDTCLVLESDEQGILKSTALKALASPWFTDEVAELGSKDAAMQLLGAWIVELGELAQMTSRRADVERVKAFMSRSVDRFRPPYGRRVIEVPRQCIFAGTTNARTYLRDETGGRRFWPIRCTRIDVPGLTGIRDQLWAEARDRYLSDEAWYLDTADLNRLAAAEQDNRFQQDPWEQAIREFLIGRFETSIEELLKDAVKLPLDRQDHAAALRVGAVLRHLGWTRHQTRTPSGERPYVFRRYPDPTPDADDTIPEE